MDFREFTNTAFAQRLGMGLGRHMPPRVGYTLARGVTAYLARRRESPMVCAVRSNLRTVLGPEVSEAVLDRTVQQTFQHVGRVYFDLYRHLALGPEALRTAVQMDARVAYFFEELKRQGRGGIVVGGHISGYDLSMLSLASNGYRATALAWAAPTSGYDLQNQIRKTVGLDFLPIDVSVLRKAMTILKAGGLLMTGVDRPVPSGGEMLPFFGRPAHLPVGHVRLALQMNVPLIVIVCEFRPATQTYYVHAARWLEMEHVGKRDEDIQHNARRVLEVLEGVIAAHPEQWMMFFPVWEEAPPAGSRG